jgi:tetratricopeptide (TPR) repeat protein
MAGLLQSQGKYEDALPLYQRALAIREKALGPDHPKTATSLNNMAELLRSQAKYEDALPLYQRALAIWEKAWGPTTPTRPPI